MSDTITIDNKALYRMQKVLQTYYNTFMVEMNDPVTSEPYVFKEMRNIGANKQASVPTDDVSSDKVYSIEQFNRFINSIVNFRVSNNVNNYDDLLKIRKSNNTQDINLGTVKHIFSCMNVINVFVDILEAYKYFIDNDPTLFKAKIQLIEKIHIVSKNHKTKTDHAAGVNKNIGYYVDINPHKSVLFISINSFDENNKVFTIFGSNTDNSSRSGTPAYLFDGTDMEFATFKAETVEKQTLNGNASVVINNEIHNYKPANELLTFEERDKALLKNFLYFLINMKPDNVRLQVNALYYYYKFVQLYTLLVLTTLNVTINNLSMTGFKVLKLSDATSSYTPLGSEKTIFQDVYNSAKTASDFLFTIDGQTNILANVPKVYAGTITSIQLQIDELINKLYEYSYQDDKNSIGSDSNLNISGNSFFSPSTFNAKYHTDTEIKLYYASGTQWASISNIANTINARNNKQILINNYNVMHDNKLYDIKDIVYPSVASGATAPTINAENTYILIKARFPTLPERIDLSAIPLFTPPSFDANTHVTTTEYTGLTIKIVKKGLLALKGDYIAGKQELKDINGNILLNTSKINNQKNVYAYQESKHSLLTNQLYAYYAILGAIGIGIIAINFIKIEKSMKQMASMIFAGIIVFLFIVYYIINASYIEDFSNKEKFFVIRNASDLIPTSTRSNINYLSDKRDFLSATIEGLNNRFIELFQKVMGTLPATEAIDFYVELNNVMKNEKKNKDEVNEILAFKKSLGYSNIDVLKYEVNNLKIYITVLLFSALITVCLYTASLYLPDEYTNLLLFIAVLFFIIIFSYYMIFSTKTVRNKSSTKYWGPEHNNKL